MSSRQLRTERRLICIFTDTPGTLILSHAYIMYVDGCVCARVCPCERHKHTSHRKGYCWIEVWKNIGWQTKLNYGITSAWMWIDCTLVWHRSHRTVFVHCFCRPVVVCSRVQCSCIPVFCHSVRIARNGITNDRWVWVHQSFVKESIAIYFPAFGCWTAQVVEAVKTNITITDTDQHNYLVSNIAKSSTLHSLRIGWWWRWCGWCVLNFRTPYWTLFPCIFFEEHNHTRTFTTTRYIRIYVFHFATIDRRATHRLISALWWHTHKHTHTIQYIDINCDGCHCACHSVDCVRGLCVVRVLPIVRLRI